MDTLGQDMAYKACHAMKPHHIPEDGSNFDRWWLLRFKPHACEQQ